MFNDSDASGGIAQPVPRDQFARLTKKIARLTKKSFGIGRRPLTGCLAMNIYAEATVWLTTGFCSAGLCWFAGAKFAAIRSFLNCVD